MLNNAALAPRVSNAWSVTRGAGVVLAVIDANVDIENHPEFTGRILPAYTSPVPQTLHRSGTWRTHGTKVAGLAGANGRYVRGVAPEALLLPVSVPALGLAVGDPAEADAIRWAADNNADVICCAWAPSNPAEQGVLPLQTREALDYCLTHGRGGKGCVLVFAAGNEGSDISLNKYASHPGVIAVGACNCHGRHPSYSNWGESLWCVFPSNDPDDPVGASMSYRTTAPVGSFLLGESFYSGAFGFTSAACAAVAGICALILSANPDLTWHDVKRVLRLSCERIDVDNATYDADGHSALYGHGRPDVARAVRLAQRELKTHNGVRLTT
jgi:subtilisin family serine protease